MGMLPRWLKADAAYAQTQRTVDRQFFFVPDPEMRGIIGAAAATVASRAKPMDNTDMDLYWRKDVAANFTGYALRELRGDDMRALRLRIARQALAA